MGSGETHIFLWYFIYVHTSNPSPKPNKYKQTNIKNTEAEVGGSQDVVVDTGEEEKKKKGRKKIGGQKRTIGAV